jgi:hypothetical protein
MDLWEKATECVRAIEATDDPTHREMLTLLQTLWTNLANESPFLGNKLADHIATIGRIHADLMQVVTDNAASHTPVTSGREGDRPEDRLGPSF